MRLVKYVCIVKFFLKKDGRTNLYVEAAVPKNVIIRKYLGKREESSEKIIDR